MSGLKSIRLPGFRHRLEVTGLNLERFLNLLSQNGIPLISVQRRSARTLGCICHSADLNSICALAQDKGWRVKQIEPLDLSAKWVWLRNRPGIPLGIVIALAAIFFLSHFVWLVEINGAGAYRAEVADYLQESGYRPGIRRNAVDAVEAERLLTYRYPEIAWFHVYVSGVRMVVDVSPGVALPAEDDRAPCDVIAAQGGIVQSIRVYAGTPAVQAGDVVSPGQVLIRGVERGSDGTQTPVQAEGVVMARCWESHTVHMPLWEIHSEETGRSDGAGQICTPWFCWPPAPDSPPFLAYNTCVQEYPVGGAFFPVTWQRIIRREVSMEYAPRKEADVRAEAAQAALKYLKTKHFGDEIIDKWVDYCMIEGDTLALTATVEWLMDIGSTDLP